MAVCLLSGCGMAGGQSDASGDGPDPLSGEFVPSGERLASSLSEYIDRELKGSADISTYQRDILDRARQAGGIALEDYEDAWSRVKRCMADRGYDGFRVLRYPNGIYADLSFGLPYGTAQEATADADHGACLSQYVDVIDVVYKVQVGNVGLYSDQYEASADCLRREGLVPSDYTAKRLHDDVASAVRSHGDDAHTIDLTDPSIGGCLVANNMIIDINGSISGQ